MDLLKIYDYDKKKRLGNNEDGGYVIGLINQIYDGYFSCGVNTEESFSRDFINKYDYLNSYNSFAFDGTINKYPEEYLSNERIKFIKKNINIFNNENNTNLDEYLENKSNLFLKMDIEGHEFKWLNNISENNLNKFSQIVIEFHGIASNYYKHPRAEEGVSTTDIEKKNVFDKLNKYFYTIHAHGNNWIKVIDGIPDVLELTFINKRCVNNIELNKIPFPQKNLDYPNTIKFDEIILDYYPFVNK